MLQRVPTVGDIMTHHAETVSMDDSILSVVRLFESRGFHHAIVTEDGSCVGVLSDRDVLATISPFVGTSHERAMDEFTAKQRVHQVMTRNVLTTTPDAPASEACRVMVERNIHCLPVVSESGAVLGIVTGDDLLGWMAEWLEAMDDGMSEAA